MATKAAKAAKTTKAPKATKVPAEIDLGKLAPAKPCEYYDRLDYRARVVPGVSVTLYGFRSTRHSVCSVEAVPPSDNVCLWSDAEAARHDAIVAWVAGIDRRGAAVRDELLRLLRLRDTTKPSVAMRHDVYDKAVDDHDAALAVLGDWVEENGGDRTWVETKAYNRSYAARGIDIRFVRDEYTDEPFERTFNIGDTVEVGSYNLVYLGKITQITAKSVLCKEDTYQGGNKRFDLFKFAHVNRDFDEAKAKKRNDEWMD